MLTYCSGIFSFSKFISPFRKNKFIIKLKFCHTL